MASSPSKILVTFCSLLVYACARGEAEQKPISSSLLLDTCKAVPEYKKNQVSYSDNLQQQAPIRWGRKVWLQIFPKRLVYSLPTLEVKLYERKPEVPRGFDPEEDTAFVLGRLNMPTETGCGLLILEDGYYSSTRIVLYPVLANGIAGTGLELADQFADADEKIVVSSVLSRGSRMRITSRLTKSVVREPSSKPEVEHRQVIWEFDKAAGFVRVEDKNR